MARSLSLALLAALAFALFAGCIGPQNASTTTTTTSTPSVTLSPDGSCKPVAPASVPSQTPGSQASVSNQPGAFSYSGQFAAKTAKDEYAWSNPSPTSRISWSTQGAAGDLHVTILDACGAKMYDNTNAAGQQGQYKQLPNGQPGNWLMRFDFVAYTGQVSISVTS